jgi:hypothetical protein
MTKGIFLCLFIGVLLIGGCIQESKQGDGGGLTGSSDRGLGLTAETPTGILEIMVTDDIEGPSEEPTGPNIASSEDELPVPVTDGIGGPSEEPSGPNIEGSEDELPVSEGSSTAFATRESLDNFKSIIFTFDRVGACYGKLRSQVKPEEWIDYSENPEGTDITAGKDPYVCVKMITKEIEEVNLDLLDLGRKDIVEKVNEVEYPVGHYTSVVLGIKGVRVIDQNGNDVKVNLKDMISGEEFKNAVSAPDFDIEEGEKTTIVMDFYLEEGIARKFEDNQLYLRPVVGKAIINGETYYTGEPSGP